MALGDGEDEVCFIENEVQQQTPISDATIQTEIRVEVKAEEILQKY